MFIQTGKENLWLVKTEAEMNRSYLLEPLHRTETKSFPVGVAVLYPLSYKGVFFHTGEAVLVKIQ